MRPLGFPLVFLLEERKRHIILGIKCIVGNVEDSFCLILLVLFIFVLELMYKNLLVLFGNLSEPITFVIGFSVGFASILIDFIVFIVAAMILNNKLLKT
jgi:hypothetical protein